MGSALLATRGGQHPKVRRRHHLDLALGLREVEVGQLLIAIGEGGISQGGELDGAGGVVAVGEVVERGHHPLRPDDHLKDDRGDHGEGGPGGYLGGGLAAEGSEVGIGDRAGVHDRMAPR